MSISIEQKLGYVESWQHAAHLTPREKEYIALNTLKFHGLNGVRNSQALVEEAHRQLDRIWEILDGYEPRDRVVMMIKPSGSPEVQSILLNV